MSKKIYVGNLSYATTEDDLRRVFEEMGEVQSVKVIKDEVTGRSKGFGFVEMTSDENADRAIQSLNGKDLLGRAMKVSEARPPAERGGGRERKPFGRSGRGRY
ncbi:MAG: RNA-binding protein [Nitrospiraceae bacterium]|nr:RNA-binding protein [Nitrospiraceae bacterium]